jgi:hypothetical protein
MNRDYLTDLREKILLLVENYELDSEGMEGVKIYKVLDIGLHDVKMRNLGLQYKFLEKLNGVEELKFQDTLCVERYIVQEMRKGEILQLTTSNYSRNK